MKRKKDRLKSILDIPNYERRAMIALLFFALLFGLRLEIQSYLDARIQPMDSSIYASFVQKMDSIDSVRAQPHYSYSSPLPNYKRPKSKFKADIPRLALNSKDQAAWEALPFIGPVLSKRIIDYGELLGGYVRKEQLKEVYGLSNEAYLGIENKIYVDSISIKALELKHASFKELLRHPYLNYEQVKAIKNASQRTENRLCSELLISEGILDSLQLVRILPYLDCSKEN